MVDNDMTTTMSRFWSQEAEVEEEASRPLVSQDDYSEKTVVLHRRGRRSWSWQAVALTWFTAGSAMVCLIFAVLILQGQLVIRHSYRFHHTDVLPDVPYETVVFRADPLYSLRPSDDTDLAWNLLMPPGRGYVFVSDPEARALPRGQKTDYGDIYSVAMYHQLHCLARIRKMYWIVQDGIVTGDEARARSYIGRQPMAHIQHCFDYLRQSIMCSGDMTLEWPKMDGVASGVAVDGWDIPHKCKSPTAIKDYMDRFHFNESLSFDAAG